MGSLNRMIEPSYTADQKRLARSGSNLVVTDLTAHVPDQESRLRLEY